MSRVSDEMAPDARREPRRIAFAYSQGEQHRRRGHIVETRMGSGLAGRLLFAAPPQRGRGYRLQDALPFLARDAIVRALGPQKGALAIEIADVLDSTSSELARRAAHGDMHRVLLAAECQTAGRGRRGRGWTSVIGGSLTFSLGWRFEQGAGYLSALPLAVGLALAEALEAEGFADIELKWPNDLLHDGPKLR